MVTRRNLFKQAGATAIGAAIAGGAAARTTALPDLEPPSAHSLHELTMALARAPYHRDFKTVPMILTHRDQWDSAALDLVLRYQGSPRQVWDNTAIASPWLNLMRNAMNTQIWSFGHPNFLCVSATHGSAHLALYDAYIWDKYHLGRFTKGKVRPTSSSTNPRPRTPIRATTKIVGACIPPTTTAFRYCSGEGRCFSAATTRSGSSP